MDKDTVAQALVRLSTAAGRIEPLLPAHADAEELARVRDAVARRILPMLRGDLPVLVAISGAGSSGKSTLFNALAGVKGLSLVKSTSGCTRRVLAAIHPAVASDAAAMDLLFEQFKANARPRPLGDSDEERRMVLSPGDPLYVTSDRLPPHLVLLDTPDFDTGTSQGFANRDEAEEVLRAADAILYVVTNATYNNMANNEFMRGLLGRCDVKNLLVVYRCYASWPEAEVREHMETLVSNIFGGDAARRRACLGYFREDDTNEVAGGGALPTVRPLRDGDPSLSDVLRRISEESRERNLASSVEGCVASFTRSFAKARDERARLEEWSRGVNRCIDAHVEMALEKIPLAELTGSFVKAWNDIVPFQYKAFGLLALGKEYLASKFGKRPARDASGGRKSYADEFRENFKDVLAKLDCALSSSGGCGLEFVDRGKRISVARPASLARGDAGDGRAGLAEMSGPATEKAVEAVEKSLRPSGENCMEIRRIAKARWDSLKWGERAKYAVAPVVEISALLAGSAAVFWDGGVTLYEAIGLVLGGSAIDGLANMAGREWINATMTEYCKSWLAGEKAAVRRILMESFGERALARCERLLAETGDATRGAEGDLKVVRKAL